MVCWLVSVCVSLYRRRRALLDFHRGASVFLLLLNERNMKLELCTHLLESGMDACEDVLLEFIIIIIIVVVQSINGIEFFLVITSSSEGKPV